MGGILGKAIFKQSAVDFRETDDNWHNIIESRNSTACSLDHADADERVRKILVEQVSSDWMRFAHIVCLNAFYDMVEEIQKENNNNELKLKKFLRRIMEINPLKFYEVISNSLYTLKRFDILLCVALNEKFSKVKKFLIEHLSTDWESFAYETHLIDIVTIVKQIDQNNKDNKSRMASFLEKLFEIEPFQYKDIIRNALITLGKLDILFGVALDENYETVKRILIESVSADWKRFAHSTYLHDIDSVVEQIDCGYSDDQSKMAAFIDKLYEIDPLNYKKLIVNSLNVASRFDVLFRIALFESNEIVIKFLLEDASSDWKKFAIYTCLYEVNSIIENIDQENNSNQMKMKALLEKLYDINSLQFKELIKSTLITMKRFSVLSAFEEEGCLGKEKEEKEILKEEISKEPVLINEKFSKVKKFLIEHLSTDWKSFAYETHLIDIVTIVKQIDQDNKDDKSRMASFLEKLFEIEPFQYKDIIKNALSTLGKLDVLFGVAFDENYETVKRILIESVSADWKRFAHCTYLHDIDSVVDQIDCGYSDDQSKMAAFIDKLYELAPLNYKKLIVNSLNVASRFDVLFRLALFESNEVVMKLLLERASSDWKKFAIYTCLYEVNCIIENIDQQNNSNQMKMKALLEKLFDINPLHFKELIKSTLITMKRFSILSAFEEDSCLGKEKEENDKVKEKTTEEPVLINGEPLVAQVGSGSGKIAVSIPIDYNLTEPAPSSSSNTGSLSHAALNDYSAAADDNKEKFFMLRDQAKIGNILDNSELLLQLKMKIGKDWLNLGRFLSISDNELDVIDAENNDLEEKAYRMLWTWKNQQKFPTLEALASAIFKINRLDLIRVLEKFSNKSFETENPLKPSIKDKAALKTKDSVIDSYRMFFECFFEAQASITEDLERFIYEKDWAIFINDGKTAHEVSHEKYFMEKFFGAGYKLNKLIVSKNILTEDEKNRLFLYSANVHFVCLFDLPKIDEWTPTHKIECLMIQLTKAFVSKNEFEGSVLPWIRVTEELYLSLHEDTNFIDNICKWLRRSNIKRFEILYRGKDFHNIKEFKKKTRNLLKKKNAK